MTEENGAPPRHQCRPGCRMSADRALARHVGVAAFIVNNSPETMERGRRSFPTAGGCPSRRLPELARVVGRDATAASAAGPATLLRLAKLDPVSLENRSPSSTISRCQRAP